MRNLQTLCAVRVSRRIAYPVLALVCAAPRLVVLLHERGAILANFTEKSDLFAQTFVQSGTFGFVPGIPSADTQPLYGWFLIPVYWILGRSWWAVGLSQLTLAIGTAWLVWEIGRRFLSPRAALAAATFATLSPYLIWHDMHVNREITDQLVDAAVVLATLALADRPRWWLAALDGVLLGLAMLSNTRLFALPVVVAAWLLWRLGRRAFVVVGIVLAFAGVAVTPWLVRNKVTVGCWALTTDGRALWKANDPFTYAVLANGGWIDDVPRDQPPGRPKTPEELAFYWTTLHQKRPTHECAQPAYYESRVFSYWEHQPGAKARLMEQAARMLWSPFVTETNGRSGAGTSLDVGRRVVAPAYTIALYVLAAIGIFVLPRAVATLTLLLLAYNTIAALAFAGSTRYRIAWDFLLALAAAAALPALFARWHRR
ncbi:MAG: ArnT family glycosyltransferase [Gaiellaceae bacterium]